MICPTCKSRSGLMGLAGYCLPCYSVMDGDVTEADLDRTLESMGFDDWMAVAPADVLQARSLAAAEGANMGDA